MTTNEMNKAVLEKICDKAAKDGVAIVPDIFDFWYRLMLSDDKQTRDEKALELINSNEFIREEHTIVNNYQWVALNRFISDYKDEALDAVKNGYKVDDQQYYIIIPGFEDDQCCFSTNEDGSHYMAPLTGDPENLQTMGDILLYYPELAQFAHAVR